MSVQSDSTSWNGELFFPVSRCYWLSPVETCSVSFVNCQIGDIQRYRSAVCYRDVASVLSTLHHSPCLQLQCTDGPTALCPRGCCCHPPSTASGCAPLWALHRCVLVPSKVVPCRAQTASRTVPCLLSYPVLSNGTRELCTPG
jgi:hypothetical protein